MNFRQLGQLWTRFFPPHQWSYNETSDRRNCTVCGQTEELDLGGGMSGGIWIWQQRGNRHAHLATQLN